MASVQHMLVIKLDRLICHNICMLTALFLSIAQVDVILAEHLIINHEVKLPQEVRFHTRREVRVKT